MKRSPLRKKSKASISRLKAKLWEVFGKYIRLRDGGTCFICGRKSEGSAYHASHFIPKSVGGIALYFHEENVHGCCYHCNINLGGNLYEYGMKLGKEKCDELYRIKNTVIEKWDEQQYLDKIDYYMAKNKEFLGY